MFRSVPRVRESCLQLAATSSQRLSKRVPRGISTRSSGAIDKWPRWSPDGSRVAFISDKSGEEEVYVVCAGWFLGAGGSDHWR
jgi:dipeptidyl aminopeptidase/acylaminoacyl peptidase